MKSIFSFLFFFSIAHLSAQNIKAADEFYKNQQWGKAAIEYQKIANSNPYNGLYWHRLGYTLIKKNKLMEAVTAFEKARPLLPSPKNATYNIACCYSLLGKKKEALHWLKLAYNEGYTNIHSIREDSDLKSIKGTKEFEAIFSPPKPNGLNRDEQWCFDIEYLDQLFKEKHFDLYHDVSKEEWQRKIHEIEKNVPHLSDDEIVGELMKLIAMVKDGHSNIFPASGQLYFPQVAGHSHAFQGLNQKWQPSVFPIQFEIFDDGVFVMAASPEHKKWVGAKVLKVGSVDIAEAVEKTLDYIGQDNSMQGKMMGVKLLRMREFYEWIKIFNKKEESSFLVELPDGKQLNMKLKTHPIEKDKNISWASMNDLATKSIPLYLQKQNKNYWFQYLKDEKIVWLQYNVVRDFYHGQNLESFAVEVFDFIEKKEVDALIIDVRNNLGGNSFLNRSFVNRVMASSKINQLGKLFVITGRRTFSAAMNFATDMEKLTNALFVGEPTGSSPNNYGEHNPFQLPFSKVQGSYSSHYFQGGFSSDDQRPWIAPDIVANMASNDFKKNIDPAMVAILEYLNKE